MPPIQASFPIANPWSFPLHGQPLRVSLPFPRGAVRDPAAEFDLADDAGRAVAPQWRVLSRWRDGSARFALLDYAVASLAPRSTHTLSLTQRSAAKEPFEPAPRAHAIRVTQDEHSLTIDTGRLAWTFSKKRFALATSIRAHGREWIADAPDAFTLDTHGQIHRASQGRYAIRLEEQGPYRVIALLEGDHRGPASVFMDYKIRLHFTAGGSQVLLSHTLRNRHDGREGRKVRRCWITGAFNLDHTVRRIQHLMRTLNTVQAVVEVPENVDLDTGRYQTTLRNLASLRERPEDVCYVVRHNTDLGFHGSCAPLIDIHQPGVGGVLVKFAMPETDREGPLRLASDQNRFEIDFYPQTGGVEGEPEPMHLLEGMGKTRDVLFNFHDDSLEPRDLIYESNNLSYPGVSGAPAAMYRDAKFADVHLALPQRLNKYPMLESKIDMLLAAQQSYDWPKASGWRDWGDEVGARGRCPELGVIQYINNEEDYLHCLMIDAWRTGKPYRGRAQARHLMDIDYIDHSPDPARDGAVCPHSTDHANGEVYPSHQWCQGLLYFYLATGDEEALRISKRIGDNLIWWCTGPRRESLTYSGRESAWPLLALAALYDVTGETKYRDAGMVIIRELQASRAKFGRMMWEHPPGSGIHSSYMQLMTFNGIWDMYQATGDEQVLELWKAESGPLVEALANPDNWGYLHFRNWPIKWADLTTLARWYELTGDEKYLRLGRNGLRMVLAGCPQPQNQTQGFIAMGYRHFITFLKLADEHGMIDDDHVTLVW